MNLLILNGPRSPRAAAYQHYRGIYRAHPTYYDALPSSHEINQLFFWFLEQGGETGLVHDLTVASRYAQLLNENPLPGYQRFEVVEVTEGEAYGEGGGQLLGFDLSADYNNSLLWWGLEIQQRSAASAVGTGTGALSTTSNTLPEAIKELYDLVHRFYAPQLNPNGLFQTPLIASQCLRSMDALQRLWPNLYEGEDLAASFRVVGVYLLWAD